jgi:hypothetical protein
MNGKFELSYRQSYVWGRGRPAFYWVVREASYGCDVSAEPEGQEGANNMKKKNGKRVLGRGSNIYTGGKKCHE